MPAQNPGDPSGMSAYGRWMYGPWFWPPATPPYGPIANPYYDANCNLDDPTTWQYQTDPFCEPAADPGHAEHLRRHGAVQRHADRQRRRLPDDHPGAEVLPPPHAERGERPLLQLPVVRRRPDDRDRQRGRASRPAELAAAQLDPERLSRPRHRRSACRARTGSRSAPRAASCRPRSSSTASRSRPGSPTRPASTSATWTSTRCCSPRPSGPT